MYIYDKNDPQFLFSPMDCEAWDPRRTPENDPSLQEVGRTRRSMECRDSDLCFGAKDAEINKGSNLRTKQHSSDGGRVAARPKEHSTR